MDNLFDAKSLKKRLIFNSLFILAYEQMLHSWRMNIISFLSDFKIEDGKEVMDKKVNDKFKKSDNVFEWLLENQLLSQDSKDILVEYRNRRNAMVHECSVMFNEILDSDKILLEQLLNIRKEVNRNWFIEIEIPTNSPKDNEQFFNVDGELIIPKDVYCVADIYFNTLKNIALTE